MTLPEEKLVQLSVKRIKEFGFYINEMLFAQKQTEHASQLLQIELALKLSFTIETNMVFLLARVYYHFPDALPDEILTDIQVQNVFEIENLKQFQVGHSEIILPTSTISTIVGHSLSHTRALFAKNLAGTLLQENLMSVVDPSTVARHFFPRMFDEKAPLTPMT